MQVYVQKSTTTTLPRNAFASSGVELIQRVAPSSGGMRVPWPPASHEAPENAIATAAMDAAKNAVVARMIARKSPQPLHGVDCTKVSIVCHMGLARKNACISLGTRARLGFSDDAVHHAGRIRPAPVAQSRVG